jgi:hypothetical protein
MACARVQILFFMLLEKEIATEIIGRTLASPEKEVVRGSDGPGITYCLDEI